MFPYVATPHSGSAVDEMAARNAPAGYTALDGGSYDGTVSAGTSNLPVGLIGVGALMLLMGGFGFARRQATPDRG